MDVTKLNPEQDADLSTQSTTQRAYLALRDAILSGDIPPGEKLKVETLKHTYSTGASPVREALSLLTSDQLVERRDQRGFRVAKASKEQFEEILNLRCKLEDLALRTSFEKGSKEWEDRLVLSHHHMSRAYQEPPQVFEQHHKAFHMALIAACDSPILLRFCDQLYSLNVRYRNLAGKSADYAKRDVAEEHDNIFEAAIERDVDRASEHLASHYRTTGLYLVNLLSIP